MNARKRLQTVCRVGLFLACFGAFAAAESIFNDPQFANGFVISADSTKARPLELGLLQPATDLPAPSWRLAQWGTRAMLQPGDGAVDAAGVWRAANAAKTMERRMEGGETLLSLRLNGDYESGGKLRAKGEAWPHLLVGQKMDVPLGHFAEESLRFRVDLRVARSKAAAWAKDALKRPLHTAQVSAYWMVRGDAAAGSAPMFWFGIPFFDVRHDVPPGHFAMDTAQSGGAAKFICNLEGSRFWDRPTGDGAWHTIDVALAPLLREGLRRAQEHGHMKAVAYDDLRFTSFNLGWEVTGPYDATLEIRNLALRGDRKAGP